MMKVEHVINIRSTETETRSATMVSSKRLADIGYRMFSGSMILLTIYGGYLCSARAYRYFQRQKALKAAAEDQVNEMIKD
ncbi:hypothetical protein chiPu_0018186 [Chiloscyllium punctatum]|uniref:Cytochrome c oxidase assembly protein COX14 n=2 Tax=Chiloscyllium TaxID=34767 RepID=A0A401RLS6_CHIPU|nr:hypothetical protein [Chiloscyllium punctatum]